MTIVSTPAEFIAAIPSPPFPVRRFSVEEYGGMIAAGIVGEDERLELLDGWIVRKMPANPAHDFCVIRAGRVVSALLPAGWELHSQRSIMLSASCPEPDLSVVKGPLERYALRHPLPEDIGLLIEVSESSLSRDRGLKAVLYARDRIPVYWILNLIDRQVETFARPGATNGGRHYAEHRVYREGETLPLVLDGGEIAQVAVSALLPPVSGQSLAADDAV